ncbi:MAG: DinB family protein [Candidatus Solibacter sp.]
MELIKLFLSELEREVKRSRRALENLPPNQRSWKPHEKSMEFGYLADMVATIPTWFTMIVRQDELDVAPKGGRPERAQPKNSAEYIALLEQSAAQAREALEGTTEAHLQTNWKLLAAGKVVAETPRHQMLRDTMNHWAHHRGQMTVYLRLLGATVPALYGPSADDKRFD